MMSTGLERPLVAEMRHGLSALRGDWYWFLLLGVALIALGGITLSSAVVASLATAWVIGILLLLGGIPEIVGAFWCRVWSGFFLHLLAGVLSVVIGLLFLRAPVGALLALTLLTASVLLVGGIFKIVAALSFWSGAWAWSLASGIIDLVLGAMIWQEWPASALWVIGVFLGIHLIFRGIDWIGLGLTLWAIPRQYA